MKESERMGLLSFIRKKLPDNCNKCGETLEKAVFEDLPKDVQATYDAQAKETFETFSYVCPSCDTYFLKV